MASKPLILVTNDDGIRAPGITALRAAMSELGDVRVVAPDSEQSAVSQAITLSDPLRAKEVHVDDEFIGWAINGTPADCVKLGIKGLLERKPDLLVSGINQGTNTATNVVYSGTVAAAIEGSIMGVPSVAFSLTSFRYNSFDASARFAKILAQQVLQNGLPEGTLLSVNIPALDWDQLKGARITRQGKGRYEEQFDERTDPVNRTYYWLTGIRLILDTEPDIDEVAIADGYISVTPLDFDLTHKALLPTLNKWDLDMGKE